MCFGFIFKTENYHYAKDLALLFWLSAPLIIFVKNGANLLNNFNLN
jgi:hypothetical protein